MKTLVSKFLFLLFAVAMSSFVFVACNDDDDNGTPPDGGKVDPSTIAADNLIAYWSFENTPQDVIGQRGTATSAVTYVTGRRGQAYQGAENAYISFDLSNTDKLATMTGFTVSAWINAPKIIKVDDTNVIGMFFQLTGTEFLGSFAFFQENVAEENGGNAADMLALKNFFSDADAKTPTGEKGWIGHDWKLDNTSFPPSRWFHVVHNYDPVTSTATVYVNGNLLEVTTGPYDLETRYQSELGGADNPNGALPLGNLKLSINASGNKGIIGFWANRVFGEAQDAWMGYYKGQLDELRVYDRALTAEEVKDLYDAEVSVLN